jgi:Na+/H+-dicarboxylate symporter
MQKARRESSLKKISLLMQILVAFIVAIVYQGIAVIFIVQFYGLDLSFVQLLTVILTTVLASIGTAGVPGAGLIMLTMVLNSVNIPLEGIALIAGIDRILDMCRTTLNVMGDVSAAVVVESACKLNTENHEFPAKISS